MTASRYVTHAKTTQELKSEFLNDITDRLDHLDNYLRNMSPNAAEILCIACARTELLDLLEHWINLKGEPNARQFRQ